MAFDFQSLQDLLVCPGSRSKLLHEGNSLVCLNPDCRLKFAVRDDIPIMLVDEAEKLSVDDWGDVMQKHSRDRRTGQVLGSG